MRETVMPVRLMQSKTGSRVALKNQYSVDKFKQWFATLECNASDRY